MGGDQFCLVIISLVAITIQFSIVVSKRKCTDVEAVIEQHQYNKEHLHTNFFLPKQQTMYECFQRRTRTINNNNIANAQQIQQKQTGQKQNKYYTTSVEKD